MVNAEKSICQYVDYFAKLLKHLPAGGGEVPFALQSFILPIVFSFAIRGSWEPMTSQPVISLVLFSFTYM